MKRSMIFALMASIMSLAPLNLKASTGQIGSGSLSFNAQPITITGQSHEKGLFFKVDAWGSNFQEISKMGSIKISVSDKDGNNIESNLTGGYDTLDNDYVVVGTGSRMVLLSYGSDLEKLGGVQGFVKLLKSLKLKASAPKSVAKNYNTVIAIIDQNGNVSMDTSVATKSLR